MAHPVLVVDDDDAILDMVEMMLKNEGYEVLTAIDGSQALDLLEEQSPSLILLDMRMPRVNGWQFAEAYQKRWEPHCPIVVMTAATDAAQRAAEIGAEGVLAKPFDLDALLAVVKTHVSHSEAL